MTNINGAILGVLMDNTGRITDENPQLYELTVTEFRQEFLGSISFRIGGFSTNKVNSVIYTNNVDLDGQIVFNNEEGIQADDAFRLFAKLTSGDTNYKVSKSVIITTQFPEDFLLNLEIRDDGIWAVTQKSNQTSAEELAVSVAHYNSPAPLLMLLTVVGFIT